MNYRHSYHAGNFADVLKHAVLARVIAYMKQKEAPFRVIDTHAGAGRYALTSPQAEKTGEWLGGIGRILGAGTGPLPPAVERLLAPYLDAVRQANGGSDTPQRYPGSPAIALSLLRPQDALVANELHPEERRLLQQAVGRDRRAKVMGLDAWVALKALLPPKERRGVILIDPPFEVRDELARVQEGLAQSLRRFAGGVYVVWYPIKDPRPVARFHAALRKLAVPKPLIVELMVQPPTDAERLNGCGLLVINAPYTLKDELSSILPELSRRLAVVASAGSFRLESSNETGIPRVSAAKRRTRTST
ncbi:MAG TPA: 23S rRNA (adenine(2030)-N(6))-methyltransferase RlmJ [Hyphomicrobiaceae bacterium]|nr:23S rRNA (adenine(2030)-N(6))-methyltransferase RlmJ [Hyphomicrobiaceae bacterium]